MKSESEPVHSFIVTLRRRQAAVKPAGGFSLDESVGSSRSLTDKFKSSLSQILADENLEADLKKLEHTRNMPFVFIVATERLANRIMRMEQVQGVARDRELAVQGGSRLSAGD